ncbi:hypothetical protein BT69DRAFT_1286901 [Atractiella rhizophila]|nr:hypothetical protein BT69DRAFT_1286901 [Atractiella rhizophila]
MMKFLAFLFPLLMVVAAIPAPQDLELPTSRIAKRRPSPTEGPIYCPWEGTKVKRCIGS